MINQHQPVNPFNDPLRLLPPMYQGGFIVASCHHGTHLYAHFSRDAQQFNNQTWKYFMKDVSWSLHTSFMLGRQTHHHEGSRETESENDLSQLNASYPLFQSAAGCLMGARML